MTPKTWLLGFAWSVPAAVCWSQTAPAADPFAGGSDRAPMSAAIDSRTDEIPLPVETLVVATPEGDRLVTPASGNPYFLGFAAGSYYPPEGEKLDPLLLQQMRSEYSDARPQAEVFAFAMFEKRITPERIAALEALGVRVLGFHPHYALRVAIPNGAVESVAAQPFLRWVGVARDWQKLHPRLVQDLNAAAPNEPLEVFISVFDSDVNALSSEERVGTFAVNDAGVVMESVDTDSMGRRLQSNGWQQRALERVGVEVLEYIDGIDTFKARMYPASLDMIVAQDNVQFVESVVRDELYHDESTPLVNGDAARATYDGSTSSTVTTGIIDSGFDGAHTGLNHVNGLGWNHTGAGTAWTDLCGHGSHVSGTILGLPTSSNEGFTGMAPGLGSTQSLRLFNVKNFDNNCDSAGTSHSTLYNHFRADTNDGSGNISPRPQVINCSWGSPGIGWIGSEANARTLDTEVWNYQQMYVFAAGNGGPTAGSIGLPGVAKNAFTVGSVVDFEASVGDPGTLWSGSSIGPAGDGRWKPNVVAPGRWIRSVEANSTTGYDDKSGTSMAAPHVTGFVAQLTDHYSFLRYAPHKLAGVVMTTALTKNDASLTLATDSHLDTYGTGRIEGYAGHYTGWTTSAFLHPGDNSYFYNDFTVPVGTERLIVCMTYNERSASAGAAKALVNNLDLWLDPHPVDPGGNTGEYSAHQSSINNTEIRYIENPQSGDWRWKVYPENVSESTRVCVTYVAIARDTTPAGTLSLSADATCVKPNQDVDLTASVYNPGYIASAVYLDSTAAGAAFQSSSTTLGDGVATDLLTNQQAGRDVLLGNISSYATRSAHWTTRWASEGVKNFAVEARADNMATVQRDLTITVDGTPPGLAANLQSTSHTPGAWSNERDVSFTWTAAPDNLSGLDGYSISTSTNGPELPDKTKDIGAVKSHEVTLSTSNDAYYFNLRSVDKCENWGAAAASDGGYLIDALVPSGAGNLQSTTHIPNQSNCEKQIGMQWTPATDGHSGLAGYRGVFSSQPDTVPNGALNLAPNATSHNAVLTNGTWYYHLRAQDVAGNWGKTEHRGPFIVNTNPVTTYCTPKVSSCGTLPTIGHTGQPRASATSGFVVRCNNAKAGKAGLLIYTTAGRDALAFQGGILCIRPSPLKRTISVYDGSGTGQNCDGKLQIDMAAFAAGLLGGNPLPALRFPGQQINCQWWGRDSVANGSLLSDGLEYTVCP